MKIVNELYQRKPRDIKIVQFGEGNFLRCFVDYMSTWRMKRACSTAMSPL